MAINKRIIKSNDEAAGGASFNTVLYDGTDVDGTGTQSVSGVGFQPDLVWIKGKTPNTLNHVLTDSVRGVDSALYSNATNAEMSPSTYGAVGSFDADGFTTSVGLGGPLEVNTSLNGQNYVAWCWKAGGAAVTNTDGTITSQVSANVDAGFSIVTWTDSFTTGQTVGHGLGQSPKIIMARTLDRTSNLWYVSHPEDNTKSLILSSTAAQNSDLTWVKGTNTFGANWTGTSFRWLAYCFAEVAGFSKFGSYTGNGTLTGPLVELGFEPAMIIIKGATTTNLSNWFIWDNKRDVSNPNNSPLIVNDSGAELTDNTFVQVDFNPTSFQVSSSAVSLQINESGKEFIYMAFANQF